MAKNRISEYNSRIALLKKVLQNKLNKEAKQISKNKGWFANDPVRDPNNQDFNPISAYPFDISSPPNDLDFWDPVINNFMKQKNKFTRFRYNDRARINRRIEDLNEYLNPQNTEEDTNSIIPEVNTPLVKAATTRATANKTTTKATASKPNTNISIVDYMNALGIDSSRGNRAQIAKELGFENYTGKANENIDLLGRLKNIEATKTLLKTAMQRTNNGTEVPTALATPDIKPEEIQKPTKFPKFLEGGTIHNYVEDPMKAIYDNNLMIDQALIQAAQETEGLKMLGSGLIGLGSQLPGAVGGFKKAFGKAEMKTGGKVPVEIEGQEVVETPQGQLFKVQGPSHEQGGIDMSLPEGTDVYSKRIQIDGKSMADRKLAREKNEKKWKKRSKYDPIAKNTLNRVKAKNQIEEMLDMSIMQAAFNAKNSGGQQEERIVGASGIVDARRDLLPEIPTEGQTLDQYLTDLGVGSDLVTKTAYAKKLNIANYTPKKDAQLFKALKDYADTTVAQEKAYANTSPVIGKGKEILNVPTSKLGSTIPTFDIKNPEIPFVDRPVDVPITGMNGSIRMPGSMVNGKPTDPNKSLTQLFKDKVVTTTANKSTTAPTGNAESFPYTPGDLLGMFGNAYQAYVNKASANAEIATDQPNINPYEGFGEDALNANSESMKYVGQIRDNALKDVALEANSAQKRGRGMSRSANTARAMDIAVSGNKNIANSKIQDAFAQQMMHLFDVKAQMENQQDMYTMKGKADQDAANRADKAARFATLRDADMSIGKAISGIGANLNTAKSREATSKLIDSMSMYGKYNWKTGELSFDTGGVDRMVEDGTWKKTVNAAGKSPTTVEEFREMAKSGKLKVKS